MFKFVLYFIYQIFKLILLFIFKSFRDIDNAANKFSLINKKKDFREYLLTGKFPEIDLMIRTGGNKRMSDFVLYDCAYSEIYFIDKTFPEISTKDIKNILFNYNKVKQNLGK